jgi:outer membrane protein assembly factor BamB
MKTMFKAFWLVIAMLALNACKKTVNEVVTPPELNKYVFVNDEEGSFYAVNAQTGALQWNYENDAGSGSYISSPAVTQDAVVFADRGNDKIFCFNTPDGVIKWTKNYVYAGWDASPVIMNNVAYIPHYSDYFEKITGYTLGGGVAVKDFMIPNDYDANSLNIVKDMFLIGTCGGHLFGVMDGIKQWEYRSEAGCYHNNPAVNDGIIYILSSNGKLSAVKAATGMEVWSKEVGDYVRNASVVYNKGMLFISGNYYYTNNDKVYAFNAADGELKHTYQLPAGNNYYYYYNAPAVYNNNLFMLSENGVIAAFDVTTESLLWQKDLSTLAAGRMQGARITFHNKTESISTYTSVVVANDNLFVAAGKSLFALTIKGEIKWQFNANDYIYSSPVVLSDYNKAYRSGNAGVVIQ